MHATVKKATRAHQVGRVLLFYLIVRKRIQGVHVPDHSEGDVYEKIRSSGFNSIQGGL